MKHDMNNTKTTADSHDNAKNAESLGPGLPTTFQTNFKGTYAMFAYKNDIPFFDKKPVYGVL